MRIITYRYLGADSKSTTLAISVKDSTAYNRALRALFELMQAVGAFYDLSDGWRANALRDVADDQRYLDNITPEHQHFEEIMIDVTNSKADLARIDAQRAMLERAKGGNMDEIRKLLELRREFASHNQSSSMYFDVVEVRSPKTAMQIAKKLSN